VDTSRKRLPWFELCSPTAPVTESSLSRLPVRNELKTEPAAKFAVAFGPSINVPTVI
jgi:hypothetical protein